MVVRVTTTDTLLLELWDLTNRSVYFPSAMWYNQGTNILVKNISEINLLCESKILHITDCMA